MITLRIKIENIVREQAAKFYPELADGGVRARLLAPVWRMHQSMIYQFCLTNNRGFSRDIVVKQRVYNSSYRNDIVADTLKEFENLRLLEKKGDGKFRVVRALGIAKEKGLLFMERVPGKRFSDLLKEFDWRRSSPQQLEEIKGCFFRSGRWLKAFHESSAMGKSEKIQVDESIREARRIIRDLGFVVKFAHLGSTLAQMQRLKDEAGSEAFSVVLKHDDFQLRNIIFENGQPIVGDVGGCCQDIALHDICDFLIGLFNFNIRYPFSQFSRSSQAECATVFLEGYFSGQRKPRAAIKFHLMLCAIRQFKSILLRNRFSPLKLIWAIGYYRDLFAWVTTWDIK